MLPAFVDLFADLDQLIKPEAEMLLQAADRLEEALSEQGQDPLTMWLLVHAVASGSEMVYSGFEKIMERIAAAVDGAPVPHSGSWHQDLLRRMERPFPAARPPFLEDDLARPLSNLCSFRHRERHMYGSQIRPDVLVVVAREAAGAVAPFGDALGRLHDHLAAPT